MRSATQYGKLDNVNNIGDFREINWCSNFNTDVKEFINNVLNNGEEAQANAK